jgi:hypothetical protein
VHCPHIEIHLFDVRQRFFDEADLGGAVLTYAENTMSILGVLYASFTLSELHYE